MVGELFTAVAVMNPTPKEEKDGKLAKVIMEPTLVVARDGAKAAQSILMKMGAEWTEKQYDLDRLDVVIRPF